MISKNFLLKMAAVSLFAISPVSDAFAQEQASSMEIDESPTSAVYGKVAYHPSYIQFVSISDDVGSAVVPTDADKKYSIGFLGGAVGAGYSYGEFRVELEGIYSQISNSEDANKDHPLGSFSHMTAMLSGYYDLAINDMVTPYAGVGIGMSMFTTKQYTGLTATTTDPKDVTVYPIALQGKVGAIFNIGGLMPYAGYKLLYFMPTEFVPNKADAGKKYKFSALSHNLEAGVMLPFAV